MTIFGVVLIENGKIAHLGRNVMFVIPSNNKYVALPTLEGTQPLLHLSLTTSPVDAEKNILFGMGAWGGKGQEGAGRPSADPWCSMGLSQWPSWHGAQWLLPLLAVVTLHISESAGEAPTKGDCGTIPAAWRTEEVVGLCWGSSGQAAPWGIAISPTAPSSGRRCVDQQRAGGILLPTGCFGWAGFSKLEDLTDR